MHPWQLAETIVSAATTDVVVAVTVDLSTNLRWAVSTPTTNGDTHLTSVWISAVVSDGDGWRAATRSGPSDTWRHLLRQAQAEATNAAPSREGAALLPGTAQSGFDEPPADNPPLVVSPALAAAFEERAVEYFGYAEQETTTTYVATSSGWRWREVSTAARFEVSAKSDSRTRSAWAGRAAATLADIDVSEAVAEARRGLAIQAHQHQLPAEPWPVILSPSATADLMLECWRNANARDAAEGRSPYSGDGPSGTALGEIVSTRELTLASDPTAHGFAASTRLWTPWSTTSATVFDTGADLHPVRWFDRGRLTALAATRAASAELKLPFVASSDCLALEDAAGTGSLADLVARTERALLVTSLWYIRDVDPQRMLVTGLTRDGTYLVVDGQIVGGAGNYRFNESPLEMLTRVTDASATHRCLPREWGDYFTRTAMPALAVDDFGLSTATSAI